MVLNSSGYCTRAISARVVGLHSRIDLSGLTPHSRRIRSRAILMLYSTLAVLHQSKDRTSARHESKMEQNSTREDGIDHSRGKSHSEVFRDGGFDEALSSAWWRDRMQSPVRSLLLCLGTHYGGPLQPAKRAISHQKACPLSLQNSFCSGKVSVCAHEPGRLLQ